MKDEAAERHSLNCMIYGGSLARLDAKETLSEEMFYEHAALAETIFEILRDGDRPDPATVRDAHSRPEAVDRLTQDHVSPINYDRFYARVRRAHDDLQTYLALTDALDAIEEGGHEHPVREDVQQALDQIGTSMASPEQHALPDLVSEVLQEMEEEDGDLVTGIRTPHRILSLKTKGWQPGHLIIRAARPSHGKTAAMVQDAVTAAKEGHAVAIFSLEMSAKKLTQRMIAQEARVNLRTEHTDDDWARLARAGATIAELPIHIDDTPGLTAREISTRMRRYAHVEGVEFVCVDYLNILQLPGSDKRHDLQVGDQLRLLRDTAKEIGVAIEVLSQLNREVEKGPGLPRPEVHHLKNSSAIEQNADVVLMQWIPGMYGIDHLPEIGPRTTSGDVKGLAEITLRKQREGEIGAFWATFVAEHTRFDDLTEREDPPPPAYDPSPAPF